MERIQAHLDSVKSLVATFDLEEKVKAIAIIVFTLMLVLTGVSVFLWMAADNWEDVVGVSVGFIFIAMSIIQTFVTFAWWRYKLRKNGANSLVNETEQSPDEKEGLARMVADQEPQNVAV